MKSVNLTDHQWRTLRLIIDHATYDIDGWIELSEEDENPARKHAYESLTADAVSIDHHIASQTHIRAY
uniref:hypothetical protein n=1 Tax=Haloglycomyces albus TaxID=526067 RepID=UPI0005564F1F